MFGNGLYNLDNIELAIHLTQESSSFFMCYYLRFVNFVIYFYLFNMSDTVLFLKIKTPPEFEH